MLGLFNRKRGFRNTPQTTLTDSVGALNDQFGYSVAISSDGNTAIVGAIGDDVGANTNQGSATVFVRNNSTSWSEQTKLTDSTGGASDQFGYSVALSNNGNTAIIGAPYDTVGANANQGSATIFTRSSSTWTEQIKITHPSGAANSRFGTDVTISGDGLRAAIGRPNQVTVNFPSVRIYFYNGSSWVFEQELTTPSDDDFRDNTGFGTSIAFNDNGDTLIVGAPEWDGGSGAGNDDTGAVLIYTRSGTTWTQQQKITLGLARDADDWFGWSVALSADGNTAIVGAYFDDVGSNVNQGSATIFTRSGTTWTQQQTITQSDGASSDYFGYSVALSADGNVAIVGAAIDDVGPVNQGSATVFTRSGGVWTQEQTITQTNGAAADNFGSSVALSADKNTAIVGAPYDNVVGANADQGSATIFYRR